MPTLESHNGYYLWHYIPSIGASILWTILFFAITCAHLWRMVKTRNWFCIPFVVGGFFEVIGYIARAAAYTRTGELIPYLIQSIFLLLAPVLFAASLYMTLGRVIRSVRGERHSIIRPTWLTKIFVGGDVFSFVIQSGGAGLMSGGDKSNKTTGQYIIIGGLVLQVLMFGLFAFTAGHFHMTFKKRGEREMWSGVQWQGMLHMLYVTSAFIMVRNVFRVVEFGFGNDGYLLSTEWPLYVFDGIPMLATMCWFFWRYPAEVNTYLDRPGHMTELTSADEESVAQLRAERRKPDVY